MTRTYALKRLLEHGPLTTAEIVEIMGGNKMGARQTLYTLLAQGIAKRVNEDGKRKYVLS